MAEWLACSPLTKANWVQSPAGARTHRLIGCTSLWEWTLCLFGCHVLRNFSYCLACPRWRLGHQAIIAERRSFTLLDSDAILLACTALASGICEYFTSVLSSTLVTLPLVGLLLFPLLISVVLPFHEIILYYSFKNRLLPTSMLPAVIDVAEFLASPFLLTDFKHCGRTTRLPPPLGEPGVIHRIPDFRMWESYQAMPLVGGFFRGSPVSPPFNSGAIPYSPHFTLIGSQDLNVKSHPNLSHRQNKSDIHRTGMDNTSRLRIDVSGHVEHKFIFLSTDRNDPSQDTAAILPDPIHLYEPAPRDLGGVVNNQARFPAGSLPDFRKRESCQTMPLVSGFSRGSPVSIALKFRCCWILTSLHPHRLWGPHC
ncbi:hypothetical protein PR048_007309 [Dryococelus australis]|uniref:Uncharacterized protein n=1 Tax=Dryococelus australis TaxID=614101 RepID=A0ABQ9ID99_9NEOP|nr:hypothetical protein PR048_007309 [Dryococelus australis]